jgi:hypothetical protein
MAVYVVLEFANDEEAKKLVQEEFTLRGHLMGNPPVLIIPYVVVGVFKRPTIFCECTLTKTGHSFTRGRKYGWWVHAKCGKPTPRWGSRDGWFSFMGTNLLPAELSGEYRPQGWETEASWNFLLPKALEENSIVPLEEPQVTTI